MSDITRIDALSDEITSALEDFNQEVTEAVNKAAEKTGKEAVKQLKATSPVRSDGKKRKVNPGSYAKGWKSKTEENEVGVVKAVVYNSKYPGLTHLNEFGHVDPHTGKRIGGKTPHIAPANESAAQIFQDEISKELS